MKMTHIKKIELVAYVYGEMSQGKAKDIQRHLSLCSSCRALAEGLEKTTSFVRQQTLKKAPAGMLEDYAREVCQKIDGRKTEGLDFLKERWTAWLDHLRLGFYPRLVPAMALVCVVVSVVVLAHHSRMQLVRLVDQETALLEEVGEMPHDFYTAGDESQLAKDITEFDRIMLAEVDSDIISEEIFDDIQVLDEFDETEVGVEDVGDELEVLESIKSSAG